MQSAYSSDRSSGEPEIPSGLATSGLATHHAADPLILTPQDINILKEYVEEFEQADTQLRKKILERAMGDIYRLRPGNSAFNKEEATQLAQELSGGAPGSQAFLGSLQDATTQLWKRLTIEEQDSYGDIAKDWSNNVPPRGIQARLVVYHRSMYFTDSCVQNGFSRYPWTDSPGLPNQTV